MKCQIMVNFILKYVNFILQKKKQKKNKCPDGEIDHGLIIDIFNQYK